MLYLFSIGRIIKIAKLNSLLQVVDCQECKVFAKMCHCEKILVHFPRIETSKLLIQITIDIPKRVKININYFKKKSLAREKF